VYEDGFARKIGQTGTNRIRAFCSAFDQFSHVEALERCQKGFAAWKAAPWSDISRGMNGNPVNSEAQMRVFWRRWNELVNGESLPPETTILYDPERDGRHVVGLAAQ